MFHRFGPRLVWTLLCLISGMTNATASMSKTMPRIDKTLEPVAVNTVGYRAHWIKRMQAAALRASQAKEPYLANQYWRLLASAGDHHAEFRLGLYYDTSGLSAEDEQHAIYWYRRAAQAGDMHAQHNLGVAYASGKGVAMDIHLAIKWWTLAARQGNASSQYNLGILYAQGEYGIKRNLHLAKHWWRIAALHGDAMAQYNLGTLYVNSPVHDYCEAAHWWHEAARLGVQQATLALRVIKMRVDYRACR